jgi:hypothetical protein
MIKDALKSQEGTYLCIDKIIRVENRLSTNIPKYEK